MNTTPEQLREIDALVAEHVMKWKRVKNVSLITNREQFAVRPDRVLVADNGSYVKNFHPTEVPADALAVFKQACVAPVVVADNGKDGWTISQVTARRLSAHAPTFEIAACLLALETVNFENVPEMSQFRVST